MKKIPLLLAAVLSGLLLLSAAGCSLTGKTPAAGSPSPSASAVQSAKPSLSPTASPSPSPTAPSATPASPSTKPTASPSPSATPSAASPTPSQAVSPSGSQAPKPSGLPSGSPSASPSASTSVKPSASTQPSGSPGPSASTGASSPSPSAGLTVPKDYFSIGDTLMLSDGLGTIKINMTEADLVKQLGQPDSKTVPSLWGADGLMHTDWTYSASGLKINLARQPSDTTSIIFSIAAAAPCKLATKLGVKIGDPKDTVLKAYTDSIDPANADTNTRIVIGSVYGGIIIGIESGAVKDIFIGAAAE